MRVGHMTPNIIRFTYRQEKGDPGYGSCLWANFDFDLDTYDLSIHSDCGCYGYGWTPTQAEPFLKLMARIDGDYLLNKLCEKSMVDWQETREELCDAVRDSDEDEDEQDYAIERLDAMADDYDLESDIGMTTALVEQWNESHCRLPDVYEYVRTDYTGDQKRIVRVFEENIRPAIRAYLKEAEDGNAELG